MAKMEDEVVDMFGVRIEVEKEVDLGGYNQPNNED